MACTHPTARDHLVDYGSDRRRWRCSACGTIGMWGETWGYFGNLGCTKRGCHEARIDAVVCSEACRLAVIAARPELGKYMTEPDEEVVHG